MVFKEMQSKTEEIEMWKSKKYFYARAMEKKKQLNLMFIIFIKAGAHTCDDKC